MFSIQNGTFQVSIRKQAATEKEEPEELISDEKKTNRENKSESVPGSHRRYRSRQRRQRKTHKDTLNGMNQLIQRSYKFMK